MPLLFTYWRSIAWPPRTPFEIRQFIMNTADGRASRCQSAGCQAPRGRDDAAKLGHEAAAGLRAREHVSET